MEASVPQRSPWPELQHLFRQCIVSAPSSQILILRLLLPRDSEESSNVELHDDECNCVPLLAFFPELHLFCMELHLFCSLVLNLNGRLRSPGSGSD